MTTRSWRASRSPSARGSRCSPITRRVRSEEARHDERAHERRDRRQLAHSEVGTEADAERSELLEDRTRPRPARKREPGEVAYDLREARFFRRLLPCRLPNVPAAVDPAAHERARHALPPRSARGA